MAVNITSGGSGTEYENQQRSDKSTQRGIIGENGAEQVIVPRFVYSKLGNFTNQKTITKEDMSTEENEYKFFMMEMERLSALVSCGELPSDDLLNIAEVDAYLGELGIESIYPFNDDSYSFPPWLDVSKASEFRNVISEIPDINGNIRNIITIIDSVTYNVIHKT